MRRLFSAVVFLAIFAALIGVGGYALFNAPGPIAASGDQTVVLLDKGMGLYDIAERLKSQGVVADAGFFAICVRLTGAGGELKAGEYAIPSGASMAEVAAILTHGKPILHRLTIAEGITSAQALRLVAAEEVLAGDPGPIPPEGSLLPETYSFPRGELRADLILQMRKEHDELVDELWSKRAQDLPLDTRQEAVTLASIVEKETAIPQERGRIAAVFINRLKRGMMLQSDPTVIYGLTGGEPMGRGLRASELAKPTPYNTYVITGLPPTPIANPGRASIEAVLSPPVTNELYFVADGSGGHVFAATLEEHQANVRKWRKYEREFLAPTPQLRHQ